MLSYHVRDYRSEDFPAVGELWQSVGMGHPRRGDSADVIARTLTHHGARLLILEEIPGGAVVGTSWMTCDGRRLHLHHFAIRLSHQGRKLAKVLLAETLRHAKHLGLQVKLEVERSNTRAITLYKKAGFVSIGDYDVEIIRDLSIIEDKKYGARMRKTERTDDEVPRR
jgi:ribosomal protein S18 acetylase RimI-like enzyme